MFEATIPSADFDVIVPFTIMPCLVSVLLAGKIRAPRILWNHRGGYDDAGFPYTRFLIGQIRKRDPVMVANSTAGAQFLTDTFSLPPGAVSVIHNVFLPDEFGNHLAAQRKYQVQTGSPLQLLHVANLFGEKDIWTVLDAMKHLKTSDFPCHLHIAGFFPNTKDQRLFEDMIRAHGIDAMVTYHGSVGRKQLQALLQNADIGLLSSRAEGSPNSVMEYMYAGLPVIGTDIRGIREVLGVPNADWLFPYGNAEHLAQLIVKLGSDPTTRQILGETNARRIVADFSADKLMPKWERILGAD